ncbi:MAG TPA: non-homologous end-joining DNA ligase [Gemmatimonadales bacterium]
MTPVARSRDAIVAGIAITHPDRVVYPDSGITKIELAQYIAEIGPLMLPHVARRPLSLVRCPDGTAGTCFFQKHWPGKPPDVLDSVPIVQGDGATRRYVAVRDVTGLVALIQWGVMEIHPWGARSDDPDHPDRIIFDLDPGPGVTWKATQQAARGLGALLDELGLSSWLKTTGGKGLHIVVPITRRNSWDQVSDFARAVAAQMESVFPDQFIIKASKAERKGLIFIDWLRNTRGATAIAPWCPRARADAGVSVPISWEQLGRVKRGNYFTLPKLRRAIPRIDDPWSDLLASRQGITLAMVRSLKKNSD